MSATTRRDFLKLAAAAAPGFALKSYAQAPLRILILGGTGFIGPHMVRYAMERGHQVSIFTRGRSSVPLPAAVERLVGDRGGDHSALAGRSWDVVLDNNAQDYRWVQTSTRLLRETASHYLLVSSISAYDAESFGYENWQRLVFDPVIDEAYPRIQAPEAFSDGDEAPYGLMKALSEDIVRRAFPGTSTVVRPGLIVGPGDPSDRFTYWPLRLAEGGEVLAPGNPNHANQLIDQRDLGEWIIRLAENRVFGDFNATGPAYRLTMSTMLDQVGAALGTDYSLTWVTETFLEQQGVRPWTELPTWIPGDLLSYVRIERALAAGLSFRPLAQTARDTLAWDRGRSPQQRQNRRAGISRERERELLHAWAGWER